MRQGAGTEREGPGAAGGEAAEAAVRAEMGRNGRGSSGLCIWGVEGRTEVRKEAAKVTPGRGGGPG